jgi:hypothetical protein
MPRLVLRLLLCLSLILNGSGYVVAATQMDLAHWAMAAARAEAEAARPPCHGSNGTTDMSMPSHEGATKKQAAPHASECCTSALCTCDCLHHATAAIAVAAVLAGMPPASHPASSRETSPLAPPFHALLRPPIA